MKTETFISKDKRTGWRAETKIRLGVDETDAANPVRWQLDITTRKGNSAGIVSHVTVGRVERGFVTHRLYTDYSRYVFKREGKCTEKAVSTQHDEALAMLETIVADVRDHYARLNEHLLPVHVPGAVVPIPASGPL